MYLIRIAERGKRESEEEEISDVKMDENILKLV